MEMIKIKKAGYIFIALSIFAVLIFGCAQNTAVEDKGVMIEKDSAMEKDGSAMKNEETMMKKDGAMTNNTMMESSYKGKILAGTASKYLEFSKVDYDKALSENKKILLYFYANWCPICKKEQAETFAAFNELNDQNLVGFRVNYKDGDDDADEKALAQQFGVAYQHTKVILKDGKQISKFPDSWNKQRYLDELAKV